jgi:hypothetical protein
LQPKRVLSVFYNSLVWTSIVHQKVVPLENSKKTIKINKETSSGVAKQP